MSRPGGEHRTVGTVADTTLQARTVRLADGRSTTVAVVVRPPAVAVVVLRIDAAGVVETLLIRQPRPAVAEPALIELVAGKMDPGETDPLMTGARELAEEVGLRARGWRVIAAHLLPSPGYCAERLHLVAAWDLDPDPVPSRLEDGHITSRWVPLADAAAMVPTRIRDAKTVIGLLLAQRDHRAWLPLERCPDCGGHGPHHPVPGKPGWVECRRCFATWEVSP